MNNLSEKNNRAFGRQAKRITVLSCALAILIAFLLIFFFTAADAVATVPETTGIITQTFFNTDEETGESVPVEKTYEIGKDVTAIRIEDFADLQQITKVNYVPDAFIRPNVLPEKMTIVDLNTDFHFAEKGTFIFVVLNLDPFDELFHEKSEALNRYKIGDYWHFTFALPGVFSASNVYLKSQLIARHGEIENYDFIEFNTSYDKKTERFSPETEETFMNLQFYTKRKTLDDTLRSAQIVTVHYQSSGTAYTGIGKPALVGTESAVKEMENVSSNLLIAFTVLALVEIGVFAVLAVLKKTKIFLPAIALTGGILLAFFANFTLAQATAAPLFWVAVSLSGGAVTMVGALLSVGKNFRRFPAARCFSALALLGGVLAFLMPFTGFRAAQALGIVCTVITAVNACALLAFVAIATTEKESEHGVLKLIYTLTVAVTAIASVFFPPAFLAQTNASFWLHAFTAVMTFVSVFLVFRDTERANAYLTANLNLEVERQVQDIRAVIGERDELLRFLSHDMKKPLSSAVAFLDTVIAQETDGEQRKALDQIRQNNNRVISNLSEIARFARYNYLAEPSQTADLNALCKNLCDFHRPDCEANGILLKNLVEKPYRVFVKTQGLENAMTNIIMNAVEHADCSTIALSAKAMKNRIVLTIWDDGKGLPDDLDAFRPYVSENEGDTGGLGLYICKNMIEAMNGELRYERKEGKSYFFISLRQA